MDCDYDSRENTRKELIAMSSNKRDKKRRKSVFAQNKIETTANNVFLKNGPILASFIFIYVFSTVNSKYNHYKICR